MAIGRTVDDVRAKLDAGLTIPAHWYTDPAVLELERELIFGRAWRYVGLAARVSEPTQYLTHQLGNLPILIVRDKDGTLRGFVNVCRHRAAVVAEGCGHASSLQCPYHGWTYSLDGTLRKAPRSEREPTFDAANYSLLPVAVDTWGPFVFANLDPDAAPLAEALGVAPAAIAEAGVELAGLEHHSTTHFDMRANWKNVAENYLECYHCPIAHPAFSSLLEVGPDDYALRTDGNVLLADARVREHRGRNAPKLRTDGVVGKTHFNLIWPTTTINIFAGPSNLALYWFEPVTPTRTIAAIEYFFGEDADDEHRRDLIAFIDEVGAEDVALVESVQRGLDSGAVPHGRVLPDSEHLIQSFQRMVHDALTG